MRAPGVWLHVLQQHPWTASRPVSVTRAEHADVCVGPARRGARRERERKRERERSTGKGDGRSTAPKGRRIAVAGDGAILEQPRASPVLDRTIARCRRPGEGCTEVRTSPRSVGSGPLVLLLRLDGRRLHPRRDVLLGRGGLLLSSPDGGRLAGAGHRCCAEPSL